MKFSSVITSLAYVAGVAAQSSPGAPYDVGSYLPVEFNNTVKLQPGTLFQPSQVASAPSYGSANGSANQPYLVVLIDINVALNSSMPSVQTELLHLLQPNLYSNGSNVNLVVNANGTNASSVVGASYLPPAPPANALHHYNVLLFRQPANFTIPQAFAKFNQPKNTSDRVMFNVTQFAAQSGLGQPIAANYFRVLNGTAAEFSAVVTNTATSGVAFPTGFSFSSAASAAGTTLVGTVSPSETSAASGSSTRSATASAATPTFTTSGAPESYDLGQTFVKLVCLVVAATLPWIW